MGLDHVVAMVAVGLRGAQLGSPALWVLPVVFPLVMAFGGLLGILVHGHTHGTELPESASAAASAYAMGFVIAAGSLHLIGIVISLIRRWPWGAHSPRGGEAAIVACGMYFLLPHLLGA